MKKTILMITAAFILIGTHGRALGGGCGMGSGARMPFHWASALNLTEDQKVQIQARQEVFAEEMSPLRDKLFSKKMELRELWGRANPDQSKISAKQQEIRDLQNEIQEKATQYQLDCRQFLTAEQQERLGTLAAQHGGWGDVGRPGPGRQMHGWYGGLDDE